MTRRAAKAYILSQRNVNMATDNQHGVDSCNEAIKALDKLDKIDALVNDSIFEPEELVEKIRFIVNE